MIFYWFKVMKTKVKTVERNLPAVQEEIKAIPMASISATPTASPSPTVKVLSFAEMNALYGPCVRMPILMYHHVDKLETAKTGGYGSLTVAPEMFKNQMEYLKAKGYSFVAPAELINFFNGTGVLPTKPVMITFDDGYMDNYSVAYPILRDIGGKAVVYLATGLMENPNYMSWSNIAEMNNSGVIIFGNHTWSHRNVGGNREAVKNEILTADTQLKERGLNQTKTFAYPYGIENGFVEKFLAEQGYGMALTTVPGSVQCSKKRYVLPRTRIGNTSLANYGL